MAGAEREGWFFPGSGMLSSAIWRKILTEHPGLVDLFIADNPELMATARQKHPELDRAIRKLGPPPRKVLDEFTGAAPPSSSWWPFGGGGGGARAAGFGYDPSAALSVDEQRHFFSEGYVHVRGAVPRALVDEALRHINSCVGRGDVDRSIPDPAMVGLPPAHSSSPAVTSLFSGEGSRLPTLVQDLLGRGNADRSSARHAQVALRFPAAAVRSDEAARRSAVEAANGRAWHVDGFGQGTHSPFTLLVGVCLSDTEGEGHDPAVLAGNLAVHPGAHWTLQDAVKRATQTPDGGAAALSRVEDGAGRSHDLGPPAVLRMRAGDVVIAHQKLPHRGMPNYSPNIRYQVYFRIRHVRHLAMRDAWLDDLMLPFEGTCAAIP